MKLVDLQTTDIFQTVSFNMQSANTKNGCHCFVSLIKTICRTPELAQFACHFHIFSSFSDDSPVVSPATVPFLHTWLRTRTHIPHWFTKLTQWNTDCHSITLNCTVLVECTRRCPGLLSISNNSWIWIFCTLYGFWFPALHKVDCCGSLNQLHLIYFAMLCSYKIYTDGLENEVKYLFFT